jgi:hypothetical protein
MQGEHQQLVCTQGLLLLLLLLLPLPLPLVAVVAAHAVCGACRTGSRPAGSCPALTLHQQTCMPMLC